MSPSAVSAFLTSLRSMLAELEALSIPTIAVIDGPALGGGCELSLGCDLRVGGSGAILALPEAKLGIIPGAGGTQRMAKLIGGARTKELVYTGRRLGGEEAERMGKPSSWCLMQRQSTVA
jgi:methylglutaconyl-CoA hydratase